MTKIKILILLMLSLGSLSAEGSKPANVKIEKTDILQSDFNEQLTLTYNALIGLQREVRAGTTQDHFDFFMINLRNHIKASIKKYRECGGTQEKLLGCWDINMTESAVSANLTVYCKLRKYFKDFEKFLNLIIRSLFNQKEKNLFYQTVMQQKSFSEFMKYIFEISMEITPKIQSKEKKAQAEVERQLGTATRAYERTSIAMSPITQCSSIPDKAKYSLFNYQPRIAGTIDLFGFKPQPIPAIDLLSQNNDLQYSSPEDRHEFLYIKIQEELEEIRKAEEALKKQREQEQEKRKADKRLKRQLKREADIQEIKKAQELEEQTKLEEKRKAQEDKAKKEQLKREHAEKEKGEKKLLEEERLLKLQQDRDQKIKIEIKTFNQWREQIKVNKAKEISLIAKADAFAKSHLKSRKKELLAFMRKHVKALQKDKQDNAKADAFARQKTIKRFINNLKSNESLNKELERKAGIFAQNRIDLENLNRTQEAFAHWRMQYLSAAQPKQKVLLPVDPLLGRIQLLDLNLDAQVAKAADSALEKAFQDLEATIIEEEARIKKQQLDLVVATPIEFPAVPIIELTHATPEQLSSNATVKATATPELSNSNKQQKQLHGKAVAVDKKSTPKQYASKSKRAIAQAEKALLSTIDENEDLFKAKQSFIKKANNFIAQQHDKAHTYLRKIADEWASVINLENENKVYQQFLEIAQGYINGLNEKMQAESKPNVNPKKPESAQTAKLSTNLVCPTRSNVNSAQAKDAHDKALKKFNDDCLEFLDHLLEPIRNNNRYETLKSIMAKRISAFKPTEIANREIHFRAFKKSSKRLFDIFRNQLDLIKEKEKAQQTKALSARAILPVDYDNHFPKYLFGTKEYSKAEFDAMHHGTMSRIASILESLQINADGQRMFTESCLQCIKDLLTPITDSAERKQLEDAIAKIIPQFKPGQQFNAQFEMEEFQLKARQILEVHQKKIEQDRQAKESLEKALEQFNADCLEFIERLLDPIRHNPGYEKLKSIIRERISTFKPIERINISIYFEAFKKNAQKIFDAYQEAFLKEKAHQDKALTLAVQSNFPAFQPASLNLRDYIAKLYPQLHSERNSKVLTKLHDLANQMQSDGTHDNFNKILAIYKSIADTIIITWLRGVLINKTRLYLNQDLRFYLPDQLINLIRIKTSDIKIDHFNFDKIFVELIKPHLDAYLEETQHAQSMPTHATASAMTVSHVPVYPEHRAESKAEAQPLKDLTTPAEQATDAAKEGHNHLDPMTRAGIDAKARAAHIDPSSTPPVEQATQAQLDEAAIKQTIMIALAAKDNREAHICYAEEMVRLIKPIKDAVAQKMLKSSLKKLIPQSISPNKPEADAQFELFKVKANEMIAAHQKAQEQQNIHEQEQIDQEAHATKKDLAGPNNTAVAPQSVAANIMLHPLIKTFTIGNKRYEVEIKPGELCQKKIHQAILTNDLALVMRLLDNPNKMSVRYPKSISQTGKIMISTSDLIRSPEMLALINDKMQCLVSATARKAMRDLLADREAPSAQWNAPKKGAISSDRAPKYTKTSNTHWGNYQGLPDKSMLMPIPESLTASSASETQDNRL